jgi:hypothetical protein
MPIFTRVGMRLQYSTCPRIQHNRHIMTEHETTSDYVSVSLITMCHAHLYTSRYCTGRQQLYCSYAGFESRHIGVNLLLASPTERRTDDGTD